MHTRYQDESQLFYSFFFHKNLFFEKKEVSKFQHLQKYIINVEVDKEYGNIFSYNVTYLAIGMTPFHAFSGYDCFIPLWTTTFTSKV
jgi:hypothetical protein